MVELQIVVLAVAGSSPVGHPPALRAGSSKTQIPRPKKPNQLKAVVGLAAFGNWDLGFGISAAEPRWHMRCLMRFHDQPCCRRTHQIQRTARGFLAASF